MNRPKEAPATPRPASRDIREGLLLCMMLSAFLDAKRYPGLLREMATIAAQEPEFSGKPEEFQKILDRAQETLHKGPDPLVARIRELLPKEEQRRRGLELAVRVATADGIVTRQQRSLLANLAESLELPETALEGAVLSAQRRLVRFMLVYLVYLTALSDGRVNAEEFEKMIPVIMRFPAFSGVTTEEFAFICRSVREHLEQMRTDKGLDYITSTIKNAADLLEDPELPSQALRLVAGGVFADARVRKGERDFFHRIAEKLDLPLEFADGILKELKPHKG